MPSSSHSAPGLAGAGPAAPVARSLAGTAPVAPTALTVPTALVMPTAPVGPTTRPAPAADPIRVVLADSHALMRRSLRLLLDGEEDVDVVGEADDLASVVRRVEGDRPDVLLLDLSMRGGRSVEAIGRLRERAPATQVVALTMEDDPVFAQRAFAAGAVGFVMTERSDAELLQAIRAAARGEQYISPQMAPRLDATRRRRQDRDGVPDHGGVPAAGR
jgi:DNA-binding NarL/FixJ family response regulator